MERILGIDPGFGRVGFGVLEKIKGNWEAISWGCIETPANCEFSLRLKSIHQGISKLIKKYQPDLAVVEDLFFAKNAKTAIKVGEARGVILLSCFLSNVKVLEFTPMQIKQAVTGYGKADKRQMQKVVQMILKIDRKITPDDAADALAGALAGTGCLNLLKKQG